MTINLDDMSLDDLKQLRKDVEKAIANYEKRQKAEAMKKLQAYSQQLGYPLEELITDKPKKSKKPAIPKYRHPENDALTWSGRGRKPRWLIDYLDKGGNLEDLSID